MKQSNTLSGTKKIGISAHSYEGGALCFTEVCREGGRVLGPHMHPNVVLSAIAMGLSMPAWESNDLEEVGRFLGDGIREVAASGADFFICPDNTAHLVLEQIVHDMPIPGLHIAEVVCSEIKSKGWTRVGLLGTKWTMTGSVYEKAFNDTGLTRLIPNPEYRTRINAAIFEELCQGLFKQDTIDIFISAIEELKSMGAQCVILGCTEIPLIINQENSPLPILDSTRLLSRYAVKMAVSDLSFGEKGWIKV